MSRHRRFYHRYFTEIDHIAEVKNLELPDNPDEINPQKQIMPNLSFSMLPSFLILGTMVMGKVAEALKNLTPENRKKCLTMIVGLWTDLEEMLVIEQAIDVKNNNRAEQIAEFVDRDHPVASKFYDLAESSVRSGQYKKLLQKLIDKDPYFFEPYLELANV